MDLARRCITISANTTWYLHNFRKGLIEGILRDGFRVTVLAPPDGFVPELERIGCEHVPIAIDSRGKNVLHDTRTAWDYYRAYARLRPIAALHFTVKPVIYGSLAARLLRVPVINTVTGLGDAFKQRGWLRRLPWS